MKIIAYYLPQYHRIPENDKWWGEGFTEWTNVKRAKPLFQGHNQPRVPQDHNYYCLLESDNKTLHWQVSLAKENGIYGFAFYHYWYCGKQLLEKPVNRYLDDKTLDLPFCLCWANHDWTNGWATDKINILMKQTYGNREQWEKHFCYLLPFFSDKRYIHKNGKPLFIIYQPENCECLYEIMDYFDKRAREEGINGIQFAYMSNFSRKNESKISKDAYRIIYQPSTAIGQLTQQKFFVGMLAKIKHNLQNNRFSARLFAPIENVRNIARTNIRKIDYDEIWKRIISQKAEPKHIPGAFVDWDNSPRKGERGSAVCGCTPQKFEHYFKEFLGKASEEYCTDMIFINAWNEWGESCYLEPDEKSGDAFLKAIHSALEYLEKTN